jgi:hypothetical protein
LLPETGDFHSHEWTETPGYRFRISATICREFLPLQDSYRAFVSSLRKNARRNLTRARRRAIAEKLHFSFEWEFSPLPLATAILLYRNNIPSRGSFKDFRAFEKYRSLGSRAFQATLSTETGEYLSVAGGAVKDRVATIYYQFNNRKFNSYSPSLTLRSFLVDRLIGEAVHDLVFSEGTGGPLASSCAPTNRITLEIELKSPTRRLRQLVMRKIRDGLAAIL